MPKVNEIYRDNISAKPIFNVNITNEKIFNETNNKQQNEKSNKIKDKLDLNSTNKNNLTNIPQTKELSEAEKKLVEEYKKIDRQVRAHEAAHRASGAGLIRGGTTFKYEIGPDGQRYAVAGEVKIDLSYDLDDPEATIRKMQQVKRTALAPSDPSPQDRAVAAKASNIEARARRELQKQKNENKNNLNPLFKQAYTDNQNYNNQLIGSIFNSIV